MGNGEYSQYNIEELYEMTQLDDPDAMDDLAQGWSNSATLFKSKYENLKAGFETIQGKWTSSSATPFLREVFQVMESTHYAWRSSEQAAEGMTNMAGRVRRIKERVADEYQKWQDAKGAATDKYDSQMKLFHENKKQYNKEHPTRFGLPPAAPDENVLRQQYDEAGRGHLNSALEFHQEDAVPVTRPDVQLHAFKPFQYESPKWDKTDWDNADWSGGGPAQYSTDPSGVAAASHATGSAPALQSGPAPGPATSLPTGGSPANLPVTNSGGVGAVPPAGLPAGGVSQFGRMPTPPTRLPGGMPRSSTPRFGQTANRTPGLPNNRSGSSLGRNGQVGRGAQARNSMSRGMRSGSAVRGSNARGGKGSGLRGGRGLQRSQMAPTDRTGRVRSSGEVMGRRGNATAKGQAAKPKTPIARRVQPPVVGKGSRGKLGGISQKAPADRTKQGFTKQVLGKRNTTRFSRNPLVANKVHDSGKVFGKRPEPVSPEEERRIRLLERRDRREKLREASEGLARPVIGNGIVTPEQLPEAVPTGPEAVKTSEDFWKTGEHLTSGIIGTRRPEPTIHHDPGPSVFSAPAPKVAEPNHYDPGPTAFGDRLPNKTNWP